MKEAIEEFIINHAKIIIIICMVSVFVKQFFFQSDEEKRKARRDYDKFFND